MAKTRNESRSKTIRVTVSEQSEELLDRLAGLGVYGRNAADVAGRFVDRALQDFIKPPRFTVMSSKRRKRGAA
jgi:hypothetical protein